MLPPAQLLTPDTTQTALQVTENNSFISDSTELEATFAEVLQTPLLAGEPEIALPFGESLPLSGSDLPSSPDPDLSEHAAEALNSVIEIATFPTTQAQAVANAVPVASISMNTSDAASGPAVLVTDGEPAEIRITGLENASAHQRERSGLLPFARSMTPSEQGQLNGQQGHAADALDELAMATRADVVQRVPTVVTEDAPARAAPRWPC